jgi:hypothetical protein
MKELIKALELRTHYNQMPLEQVAKEFAAFSEQEIPQSIVDDFEGFNNINFLTSDFLIQKGLKNLYQVSHPARGNDFSLYAQERAREAWNDFRHDLAFGDNTVEVYFLEIMGVEILKAMLKASKESLEEVQA